MGAQRAQTECPLCRTRRGSPSPSSSCECPNQILTPCTGFVWNWNGENKASLPWRCGTTRVSPWAWGQFDRIMANNLAFPMLASALLSCTKSGTHPLSSPAVFCCVPGMVSCLWALLPGGGYLATWFQPPTLLYLRGATRMSPSKECGEKRCALLLGLIKTSCLMVYSFPFPWYWLHIYTSESLPAWEYEWQLEESPWPPARLPTAYHRSEKCANLLCSP